MAYAVGRARRRRLDAQGKWKPLISSALRTMAWVVAAFVMLTALDRHGLLGQSPRDPTGACGPSAFSSSRIAAIDLVVGGRL